MGPALFLSVCVSAAASVLYVDVRSASPTPPFADWSTAAVTIQDAVDVAVSGDEIVVTNGVYKSGGRVIYRLETNRVAVYKPLFLRSVNGPEFTLIQGWQVPGTTNGDGAVRCVYLTNGASLTGFTLTNGATCPRASGGGLWCESTNAAGSNCVLTGNSAAYSGGGARGGTLSNCRLTGNTAWHGGGAAWSALNACILSSNLAYVGGGASVGSELTAGFLVMNNCILVGNRAMGGGGAYSGTLNSCAVVANSAWDHGGGAWGARLYNCTVVGNWAGSDGGGTTDCRLTNCISYYNTAPLGMNYWISYPQASRLLGVSYCCTAPLPTNGFRNITNEPLFVDAPGGDLRLRPDSPCINNGHNAYAPAGPDLGGNPRIVGGTVDIGAYEFQSPGSRISYAWLQFYALPTDGSTDIFDSDGDGMNNLAEWRAGTDPTNALSVLRMLSAVPGEQGTTVQWQSIRGLTYYLERSTNLAAQAGFSPVQSNIVGQAEMTSYTDPNVVGSNPCFYRVGVQ